MRLSKSNLKPLFFFCGLIDSDMDRGGCQGAGLSGKDSVMSGEWQEIKLEMEVIRTQKRSSWPVLGCHLGGCDSVVRLKEDSAFSWRFSQCV